MTCDDGEHRGAGDSLDWGELGADVASFAAICGSCYLGCGIHAIKSGHTMSADVENVVRMERSPTETYQRGIGKLQRKLQNDQMDHAGFDNQLQGLQSDYLAAKGYASFNQVKAERARSNKFGTWQ